MITSQKITIIKIRRPISRSLNEELQWLGQSLGLFSSRDKDKSCFRIFVELIKGEKKNTHYSSQELAEKADLARSTVIFHLNKLIESGIVIEDDGRYMLRVHELSLLINEMKKDIERTMEDLKQTASEIDKILEM